MLMHEPFGALDPVTREQLSTAVRRLHDTLGLTTIMVTHDMAEALLLADRVLVMQAGRIVADATPGALLAGEGGAEADALVAVPRDPARRLRADRKSTRLNSSHQSASRMPSSAWKQKQPLISTTVTNRSKQQ